MKEFKAWEAKARVLGIYDNFKFKEFNLSIDIDGSIINKKQVKLIDYKRGAKVLELPPVDEIEGYLFSGDNLLEEVIINDKTSVINSALFNDCLNLRRVTLGKNIKYIPISCFNRCRNLEEVIIKGVIVIISSQSFSSCYKLSKIELKEGLEKLDNLAFYNSGITELILPKTVNFIGEGAIASCPFLKKLVINSKNINFNRRILNRDIILNRGTNCDIEVVSSKMERNIKHHLAEGSKCHISIRN